MMTILLTCWACEREWSVERRRGQYPRHCPTCRKQRGGGSVKQLARRACARGLAATVERLPKHGDVVMVTTPFHAEPVRLVDDADLDWLVLEVAHRCEEAPRAA